MTAKPLTQQAELVISYVLRGGVMCSAALIALGVIRYVWLGPRQLAHMPATLGAIWSDAWQGNALALIMAGLIVLLATPILRVLASILIFAIERDQKYIIITTIVLVILLVSLAVGKGGV